MANRKDNKSPTKDMKDALKDNPKEISKDKDPKNVKETTTNKVSESNKELTDKASDVKNIKDIGKDNKVSDAFEASTDLIHRIKVGGQHVVETMKDKAHEIIDETTQKHSKQMQESKQAAQQTFHEIELAAQQLSHKPTTDIIVDVLTKIVAFIEYCVFLLASLGYKLMALLAETAFGKWLVSMLYPLFLDVSIRSKALKHQSFIIIESGINYVKKTQPKKILNDTLQVTYEVGYWIIPTLMGQKPQPKMTASQEILEWIIALLDLMFFFRPRRLVEVQPQSS